MNIDHGKVSTTTLLPFTGFPFHSLCNMSRFRSMIIGFEILQYERYLQCWTHVPTADILKEFVFTP